MLLRDLIKKGKLEDADVAIVGIPFDKGVVIEGGRKGADMAPKCIREQLYKYHKNYNLKHDVDLSFLRIVDLGDIDLKSLRSKNAHEKIFQFMKKIFKKYSAVIVLGGGHDISYSTVRAFSEIENGEISGVNLDAHFDVKNRDDFGSGTGFGRLLREGFLKGKNFAEIGMHDNFSGKREVDFLKKNKVCIVPFWRIEKNGVSKSFSKNIKKIQKGNNFFMSVDIDSAAEIYAPGCSAPSSDGFSAREIIRFSFLAGKQKGIRLFEIMEVNPKFDIDNRTCRLAATMITAFLTGLAQRKGKK